MALVDGEAEEIVTDCKLVRHQSFSAYRLKLVAKIETGVCVGGGGG